MKCIDFTSGKGKKRQLNETIQSSQYSLSEGVSEFCQVPKVSSGEEIDIIYKNLSQSNAKPGIYIYIYICYH